MIYVPANNNLCGALTGEEATYTPGRRFVGMRQGDPSVAPGGDHFGEVQAWNVDTGKLAWTHKYDKSRTGARCWQRPEAWFSPAAQTTARFTPSTQPRQSALEYPTNSGILAPPTSFLIDGKQYIAVLSGWGGDSRGMEATLNRLFPGQYPEVPEGGAIWVFAVE